MKKCLILNNREPYPENILDHIPRLEVVWYQDSSSSFSVDKALDTHRETHILVTNMLDLNATRLEKMPELELIITLTTSVEFIDADYCLQKGIAIKNTAKYGGTSVAEHAVALMMTAAKRIVDFNTKVRTGDFQMFERQSMELAGKNAGILGLGNIGRHLADILMAFGMKISYCNRNPVAFDHGTQVDMDTLLAESDILFLTLSHNENSKGIMNKEAFFKIKPGTILISISPDGVIEFEAFKEALESGRLSYAGIDLHHQKKKYMVLPNLIITPRRAWYTKEAFERRTAIWVKTLFDYMEKIHA